MRSDETTPRIAFLVCVMGIYSRHVFPRLCDWAMRDDRFGTLRRSLLSQADG